MQVIDLITVYKLVTRGLEKLLKSFQLQSLALVTVRMCNILHARMAQCVQDMATSQQKRPGKKAVWQAGSWVPSESAGRSAETLPTPST